MGSDPVTVQLTVINKTGKDMRTNATFGVDAKDVWHTMANGETYVMKSNTHSASGTVFTLYPVAPDNKQARQLVTQVMEQHNKRMVIGVTQLILLVTGIAMLVIQPHSIILLVKIGNFV